MNSFAPRRSAAHNHVMDFNSSCNSLQIPPALTQQGKFFMKTLCESRFRSLRVKQGVICTYSLRNERFKAVLKPACVQVHYHAMHSPAAPPAPAFISSGGNWEGNWYFCCLLPLRPHHSPGKEGMHLDQEAMHLDWGFSRWQRQLDINFYVLYINQFERLS